MGEEFSPADKKPPPHSLGTVDKALQSQAGASRGSGAS